MTLFYKVSFVLLWSVVVVSGDSGTTARNTELHTPQSCPQGTFMNFRNLFVKGILCLPCTQADQYTHEVEIEPCSTTKDAVIHCADSYYRKRISSHPNSMGENKNFECTPCRKNCENIDLPYEIIPCRNYTNRVCCKDKNMKVVNESCLSPTTERTSHQGNPETLKRPVRITGTKVEATRPAARTPGPSVGYPGPKVRKTGDSEKTTRPTMQSPHTNDGISGDKGKTAPCLVLAILLLCPFYFRLL